MYQVDHNSSAIYFFGGCDWWGLGYGILGGFWGLTVILGRGSEGRPQGLKPLSFFGSMRAKPEGLAYLDATAKARAKQEADSLRE